jgi:hypothetical protein
MKIFIIKNNNNIKIVLNNKFGNGIMRIYFPNYFLKVNNILINYYL